jgi:1-deoxy-D-xylulose-5-phosphate reductoisomerase
VLTASGGPFRERREPLETVLPHEALAHPTWEMGAKISVDSATLMNKGLELIEATHLFGVDESRIEVLVHPQSIVHSLVEFRDGSWMAQLSVNDMVFPLQYALAYPERWDNDFPRLDLQSLRALEFLPVDEGRFPAIGLARKALRLGDAGPAVYNAANEVAVHAFLQGAVPFTAIFDAVAEALEALEPAAACRWESIEAALEVDRTTRERTRRRLAARHPTTADRI